ncbi:MAG: class I lanthipeptide [Kofleriaceae bacterium]
MKKDKTPRKLLALGRETVKKLADADLAQINGGGSCLPPPKPAS